MFSNLITFLVRCKYFNYFLINFNIYTGSVIYLSYIGTIWRHWQKRLIIAVCFTHAKSFVRGLHLYLTVVKSLVRGYVL